MPDSRQQESWGKSAARGVGLVIGLGLAVLGSCALLTMGFHWAMGAPG